MAKKPTEPEAVDTPDDVDGAEPVKSRWATMRDEARGKHKALPPYQFDATDPPILITAPDSADRATALAALLDRKGNRYKVSDDKVRELFRVVCGDAWDDVWEIVGPEPIEVLFPLFEDINHHFQNAVPGEEGDDLPGGE